MKRKPSDFNSLVFKRIKDVIDWEMFSYAEPPLNVADLMNIQRNINDELDLIWSEFNEH